MPHNDGMEWYEEQMHEYSSSLRKSAQQNSNSKSNSQKVEEKKPEVVPTVKEVNSEALLEEEKKARWQVFQDNLERQGEINNNKKS